MATLLSGDACLPTFRGRSEDDDRPRRRWFEVRRGEPAAAAAAEGTGQWLSMAPHDTCRVADVRDFPVRCREGTLWVTSPEDPGDSVVAAGERLNVTSRGTIMVVAVGPSSMWLPEGFAVDDAKGLSSRSMGLRRLRQVGTSQRPAASATDEARGPTTEMVQRVPTQKFSMMSRSATPSIDAAEAPGLSVQRAFQRAVAALARCIATGTADARERYLSLAVDHADFENRIREWDAHEARLRRLPPVL